MPKTPLKSAFPHKPHSLNPRTTPKSTLWDHEAGGSNPLAPIYLIETGDEGFVR